MIEASHFVVGTLRCGTEPHFVIEITRCGRIGRRPKSGHDVTEKGSTGTDYVADIASLQELFCLLIMFARALLRSDLNNAVVAACSVDHPAAFLYKQS